MDWEKELYFKDEHPLEHLTEGYSNTSIFRTMAVIGDSLASGEFEVHHADSTTEVFDMFDYSWGQFLARKNGIKVYNFRAEECLQRNMSQALPIKKTSGTRRKRVMHMLSHLV